MSNLNAVLTHMTEKTPTFKIPMLSDEKKSVWIRPLKTKDQKYAVIARDEGEGNDLLNFENIINLVDDIIVKQDVAIAEWTIQDFVYFLIQFRIKTMGELIEISSPCKHCGESGIYTINLVQDSQIEKPRPIVGDVITVSDKLKLMLGHLTVDDMHTILEQDVSRKDITSLGLLIKGVEFEEQLIETSAEEKVAIAEELTKEQAEYAVKFTTINDYGITISKNWKCKSCESDNSLKFNGFEIINFF